MIIIIILIIGTNDNNNIDLTTNIHNCNIDYTTV